MTTGRLRVGVAITVAAIALMSSPARADMTKDQCIDANAKAQDLRRDHSLSAAREQIRRCVDPSCPALVRADCVKRLDELESVQPTIAFEVKDGAGNDVTTVSVTVDGKAVPERLNGTALPLDPGPHVATFEAPGLTPVTRTLVLTEGQRGRRESVVLVAPTEATPVPSSEGLGTQRLVGVVAGGAGIVGLAIGSIFGAMTLSEKSKQESVCESSATCTSVEHAQAVTDHGAGLTDSTIATIGMIAGAACIAGGAALFFSAHSPARRESATMAVVPSVEPGGGTLLLRGYF